MLCRVELTYRSVSDMKMYTCENAFKTTFFNNGNVERIEIEEGSDWFLVRKETQDRIVLCNNKIELIIAKDVLKTHFKQWG